VDRTLSISGPCDTPAPNKHSTKFDARTHQAIMSDHIEFKLTDLDLLTLEPLSTLPVDNIRTSTLEKSKRFSTYRRVHKPRPHRFYITP
jgi:hypothetical protein